MGDDTLRIIPETLVFQDVEEGETDTIEFAVSNISKKTMKIRFIVDDESFYMAPGPDILISPGLTIKKKLRYTSTEPIIRETKLRIVSENNEVEVPVIAYPPTPSFTVNTTCIDMGNITASTSQSHKFTLTNFGTREGRFLVISTNTDATFHPNKGIVYANSSEDVFINFKPSNPGHYEFDVTIEVEDSANELPKIRVIADVLNQAIIMLDDGKETDKIYFGRTFHGQKAEKIVTFQNKAPIKYTFSLTLAAHQGKSTERYFMTKDTEYTIEPLSEIQVPIIFAPPTKSYQDNLEELFEQVFVLAIKNTSYQKELTFTGKASHLILNIKKIDFCFNEQRIKTVSSQILEIENRSNYTVPFKIRDTAQFSFSPSSGTLKANDTTNVLVNFVPNNLGNFVTSTQLIICNGFIKRQINLSGISTSEPEATFTRRPLWETDVNVLESAENPSTPFSMTLSDLRSKTARNSQYRSYITDYAETREAHSARRARLNTARTKARNELAVTMPAYTEDMLKQLSLQKLKEYDQQQEIDLGLKPTESLKPPEPNLTALQKSTTAVDSRVPSPRRLFTPANQGRAKIKAEPTTKMEKMECQRELNAQQLLSIIPSAEEISFGTVCVFAESTKQFQITNNLNQNIHVVFDNLPPNFAHTNPKQQLIAPQKTASFNIVFKCDSKTKITESLKYRINKIHEFAVICSAKTIPLTVKFSEEEMLFKFQPEMTEGIITKQLTVTNPTTANAKYEWKDLKGGFSIKPLRGVIGPNNSQQFDVVYKPTTESKTNINAKFEVEGGPPMLVKLVGEALNPVLALSKDVADFDRVPLEVDRCIEITLTNNSDDFGLFSIAPHFTDILTIDPPSGRIMGHESIPIFVNVCVSKPGRFEIPVQVNICGQSPIPLQVVGHAEMPHIDVEFDNLNFGSIFIGNYESRVIKVTNSDDVMARILFDITQYPNFKIDWIDKNVEKGHGTIKLLKETFYEDVEEEDQLPERVYQIELDAFSSIEFELVFKPSKFGKSEFDLPFEIDDGIDIRSSQPMKVFAKALKPPIVVSAHWVDFGIAIQTDEMNPNIRPTVRQLILTNEYKGDVKFHFDTSKIDPAFAVEPAEGIIKHSMTTVVFVTFRPTSGYLISCQMPLYATTDVSEFLCAKIEITAIINSRPIKPSQEFVSLPAVPLGMKTERTIYIENTMAVESDLDVIMPVNEQVFPLTFNFPDGRHFEHTTEKLPLSISFINARPLSFSTQVAVVDTMGNSCKFTVAAITDNSVLSLHQMIHADNYTVSAGHGGPILANMRTILSDSDIISKFLGSDDVKDAKDIAFNLTHCTTAFLVKFLNTYLLATKIQSFPEDMTADSGDLIIEMIVTLLGNQKPQNLANIQKMKANSTVEKVAKIKEIMNYLLTNGAHLANIKPELLLSKEDFIRFHTEKIINNLLASENAPAGQLSTKNRKISSFINSEQFKTKLKPRIRVLEELYEHVSVEAWMHIVFQVLKVFLLSKSEPEKFYSIGGVKDAIGQLKSMVEEGTSLSEIERPLKSLQSSNFMTAVECSILKWVSIFWSIDQGRPLAITDFIQLRNPLIYAAIIKWHIPTVDFSNLIRQPKNYLDFQENAKIVSRAVNGLQTGLTVTADFLMHGCPVMHVLFAFQLMEALPHYIPTQTIEFDAQLNEKVTQSVSISNPSRFEIVYVASISGSNDFSLMNPRITVHPNSHAECQVVYMARSHSSESAILSLIPRRHQVSQPSNIFGGRKMGFVRNSMRSVSNINFDTENPATPAAIIINLHSNVRIGMPKEKLEVKGVIYEVTPLELQIKNLLGRAGTFKIYTRTSIIMDEYFKMLTTPTGDLNMLQQMVDCPDAPPPPPKKKTKLEQYVAEHNPFVFKEKVVQLSDDVTNIQIDFVPVGFGISRCIILFVNDDIGEFLVEVTGKAILMSKLESTTHCKAESMKSVQVSANVEYINTILCQAIAYARTHHYAVEHDISPEKLREMLVVTTREVTQAYSQFAPGITYQCSASLPEFITHDNIKLSCKEDGSKPVIEVTFSPTKPGTYAGRIIMMSKFDARIIKLVGIAYAATKHINVEFKTFSGKPVMQTLPFENPSKTPWNFKVILDSSNNFTCPNKLVVMPKTIENLPIKFCSIYTGKYHAQLTVTNLTKESTVIYNISATVEDPLAEDKIEISGRAREKFTYKFNLPSFVQDGLIKVETDVPIMSNEEFVEFKNGKPTKDYIVTILSKISGTCVGTIKFKHIDSGLFCWYVLNITITKPLPSGTFDITTIQRSPVEVRLPMINPTKQKITFDVSLSSRYLHGDKFFIISPHSEEKYILKYYPFFSCQEEYTVSFFNENEGEYIFILNVTVTMPDPVTIAPVSAQIGRHAKTYLMIDNHDEVDATVYVQNDNPAAFMVMSKECFTVSAKKSKSIEVRYLPTLIGETEKATISFNSAQIGDYIFELTGVGKPPQQQSPTIVESALMATTSSSVIFSNPFQCECSFEASIFSEEIGVFSLLQRRHLFTLYKYNDQQQISFSFMSKKLGQSTGAIVVTCRRGREIPITWKFPIIGVTNQGMLHTVQDVTGKAGQVIHKILNVNLTGEQETFPINSYRAEVDYTMENEWLQKYLEVRPHSIKCNKDAAELQLEFISSVRKPFATNLTITVTDRLGQTWQLPVRFSIGRGDPIKTITIEASISMAATVTVTLPEVYPQHTEFCAYFLPGAAPEFKLSADGGYIDNVGVSEVELPLEITFTPHQYGKIMRAMLVIEMEEIMSLVEVVGKMPEYIPPVISKGRINCTIPPPEKSPVRKSKRNIIRDNIEMARITKPRSARRQRRAAFV